MFSNPFKCILVLSICFLFTQCSSFSTEKRNQSSSLTPENFAKENYILFGTLTYTNEIIKKRSNYQVQVAKVDNKVFMKIFTTYAPNILSIYLSENYFEYHFFQTDKIYSGSYDKSYDYPLTISPENIYSLFNTNVAETLSKSSRQIHDNKGHLIGEVKTSYLNNENFIINLRDLKTENNYQFTIQKRKILEKGKKFSEVVLSNSELKYSQ